MTVLKNPTKSQLITIELAREIVQDVKNLSIGNVITGMMKKKMDAPIGLNDDRGINSRRSRRQVK